MEYEISLQSTGDALKAECRDAHGTVVASKSFPMTRFGSPNGDDLNDWIYRMTRGETPWAKSNKRNDLARKALEAHYNGNHDEAEEYGRQLTAAKAS